MTNKQQFNDILNACLEGLLTGSITVDECLKQYPEQARELEPLLRTALTVGHAVDIKPAPEMKAHVRYHLQLKMAEIGRPHRTLFRSWQPRWAIAVIAVLLVFILGSGTVWAANSSMPGSPLYPVKIATENVRLNMTGSPVTKAELYAAFADRRVVELGYIAEKGNANSAQVEQIAERYTYCVTQINTLPLNGDHTTMIAAGAMQSSGMMPTTEAPSTTVAPTVTFAPSALPSSPPVTGMVEPPPTTETRVFGAISTDTQTNNTQGKAAAVTTPPAGIATNETALAKLTPAQRDHLLAYFDYLSTSQPEQLESFLDKFPEQAKPAIRRMIQDAKESYSRMIQKIQHYQNQQTDSTSTP